MPLHIYEGDVMLGKDAANLNATFELFEGNRVKPLYAMKDRY